MITLRARVIAIAAASLVAALTLVGTGTAALLHTRASTALDRMLLAAAFAEAHPWQEERFDNEYAASPVDVSIWNPAQPAVDPALHDIALRSEQPTWVDQRGQRILLLAFENEELDDVHQVVVAQSPAVAWQQSVLPFALSYVGVSTVAVVLGVAFLFFAMTRALLPLEQAAHNIGRVGRLEVGRRLDETGPPETRRLLVATNHLLERLDSAFATQASFTAQAAHELRTPVTTLRGEVELALRRQRTAEEYRAVLHRLGEDFERLHELVEGLLLLARVDAGHIEQGKRIERVSAPIHQALLQEHDALSAAGCRVHVELVDDPEVSLHIALLTTALATLLRNVAVHAPGAGVEVSTRIEGGELKISVHDDGPGIADPERMLERFERASPRGGLGLGLPIAQEIARRHGGDLTIASDATGTTAILSVALDDFSSNSKAPLTRL